nr:hypothetical protein [uncultured Blautia sp.]
MIRNKIKKKLQSKQGTSIFFGLLLFLIASILSTVMLSASVTAVKSVESDRKTEQSYLTCSSAAKMLRDAIQNTCVVYKRTIVTSGTQTIEDTSTWSSESKDETIAKSKFAEFLKDYVEAYEERNLAAGDELERTYTISVPADDAADINTVTAKCTIKKGNDGNDIVIKLKTGDTVNDCQIVVKLVGKKKTEKTTTPGSWNNGWKTTTIDQNIYTWDVRDFIYGDQERTSEAGI